MAFFNQYPTILVYPKMRLNAEMVFVFFSCHLSQILALANTILKIKAIKVISKNQFGRFFVSVYTKDKLSNYADINGRPQTTFVHFW